jgi:hypothetical protein
MASRRQVLAGACLALTGAAGCAEIRETIAAETTTERTGATENTERTETTDTVGCKYVKTFGRKHPFQ